MNHCAQLLLTSGVLALIAGCASGSPRKQHAESALANALAGQWDISLQMDRPPALVTGAVGSKRNLDGTLAFLANRSLEAQYSRAGASIDYGTYDIDFTAFGFDPRDDGKIPTLVVDSTARDSIAIVLTHDPGGIAVKMQGGIKGDTIRGRWQVFFPRLGAGGGSFHMTPRRSRKF
ncbi:MAG: hypothetical protein ABI875_02260 [Gemmatimonadales bacterium]